MNSHYNGTRALLANKIFRRYFFALVITQLTAWIVPAIMPIFLNARYGIGNEFVLSMGLQWLPSILMFPIVGTILDRWGTHRVYIIITGISALPLILIPLTDSFWQLQFIVLVQGICQAISSPASLTLRTFVIPKGKEIAGNSLLIGLERLSKILGPLIAGIFVVLVGVDGLFYVCGLASIPSVIALSKIPIKIVGLKKQNKESTAKDLRIILKIIVKDILHDDLILGFIVTAIGYTITLGGLRVSLFALSKHLGDPNKIWTLLLSSQGFGALAGVVLGSWLLLKLQTKFTLPQLYALVSLAELTILSLVSLTNTLPFIFGALALAASFETMAFIRYFTVLQKRIDKEKQGDFNSMTMPFIDSSFLIGLLLAGYLIEFLPWKAGFLITLSFAALSVVTCLPTFFKNSK